MGMTDAEIVALSGAHTIGRAYKERSGLPSLDKTKYTCCEVVAQQSVIAMTP